MGADTRPTEVVRIGIREVTAQELKTARASGETVRLISRAEMTESGLKLSTSPAQVPISSPYGAARGTSNVLVLETDLMGTIAIFEFNPGVEQTAYALLSDMIAVCA
jgi:homoserine dehydrogenase